MFMCFHQLITLVTLLPRKRSIDVLPLQVASLPELPDAAQCRLETEFGLGPVESATLVGEEGAVSFFDATLASTLVCLTTSGVLPRDEGRVSEQSSPSDSPRKNAITLTRRDIARTICNWILNECELLRATVGYAPAYYCTYRLHRSTRSAR